MDRTFQRATRNNSTLPELWGGFECTINRVGDSDIDQFELSGHYQRESDLELLRDLGIKAVRYPILWERFAPNGFHNIDWSWADRRLNKLRELGIRPIVGLVHHGSGPRHTNLLDPEFPELLAQFARLVAERYPWVDAYTPVNEPLTTARFSCLYGHWYPHLKDTRAFLQALMHETRGTVLAMREIRKVNPAAQLIQTEDLAKIYSTPRLDYQAELENHRRWLSLDLLCGRVDRYHELAYLFRMLELENELPWFADNPCVPDIMGFNYYLSSERFLDDRTELYSGCAVGGNERDRYVDVEAARVLMHGIAGAGALLGEAWDRYHLPLAITELHNGCTREEQARWFVEQWKSAASVVEQGIDLRAVTAWTLLGSHNWNTLVTCKGVYEPGVYELRAPKPVPTLMAEILQQIAKGKTPDHPVLATPGWWRRPARHIYGVTWATDTPRPKVTAIRKSRRGARPILITGRTGTLGRAFAKICQDRGLAHHLLGRAEMDIADLDSVKNAIEKWQPWAIVNAAGYVRVDDAEVESDKCMRENATGPSMLAAACQSSSVQLVTFSSDLVFDGSKGAPYVESDPVAPVNVYGHSKAEAEQAVLELCPSALVVRTSAFFGPWDEYNFVTVALRALSSGKEFVTISDYIVSPTYVPDLVHCSLDLLLDRQRGIWHLANRGAVSWSALATMAARMADVSTATLVQSRNCEWRFAAVRPHYSVLGSEKASIMPTLENALDRYLRHPELVWSKAECACEGDVAA